MKTIYDAVSMAIPTEELMGAAQKFLLHSGSHRDVVPGKNIVSPQFGSSDLLFVNHGKTRLTVARLNDTEDIEKFIVLSMSYYVWLKESVTVGEIFSSGKIEMDMYLFSHDFSPAVFYLMHQLAAQQEIHLIKYHILQVEGLDEPGIYFQRLAHRGFAQDTPLTLDTHQEAALPGEEEAKETSDTLEISPEELSEFNRLEERYLSS